MLRISKDPAGQFIIQPYFRDLFNNIKEIYQKKQQQQNYRDFRNVGYKNFTCYRGAEISEY